MKKNFKILLAFFLFPIVLGMLLIWGLDCRNQDNILNRVQCLLMDKNTIAINVQSLDINDFEVRLYPDKVVFENGQKVAEIPRAYGGVDFFLYYKKELIGQAGIDNRNSWQTHDFIFDCTTVNPKQFKFEVKGPESNNLYFKQISFDSSQQVQTELFYNASGLTGQINKNYYDASQNLVVDEIWENGTLITLNLYEQGEFSKNYSTNKFDKTARYELHKIDSVGVLVYEWNVYRSDTTINEKIIIKN